MSIRARVAFGLICVERAADQLELKEQWLDDDLQRLWRYTEEDELSWWGCSADVEEVAESCSDSAPRARLNVLARMLTALDEIGGGNLFGGFRNEFTHTPTMELAAIMAEQEFPLPPTKPFIRISPRRLWNAWGRPFTRADLRRMLHHAE